MRIAMMTNNYLPFVGGVPISIERLANGLRELGNEVFIFAPSYEGQTEEDGVIRIRSMEKKLDGNCVIPDIFDPELERQFRSLDIDMIHVHHPMVMGYAGLYLGKRYGVPVAFTYHTRYEHYLHNIPAFNRLEQHAARQWLPLAGKLEREAVAWTKERLVPAHMKTFANLCDIVFAPTPAMESYLRESGVIAPVEVLPTGLKCKDFESDGSEAALRNSLIGDKKYLFCTVSRLTKEKNLYFLLDGLCALKKRLGDTFRLLIIGGGPLEQQLKDRVKALGLENNVTFAGTVNNDGIGRYYRACDLFLFASKSETQGIVLLEAMAARLPVVAVDASGVCDIVKDGCNGFKTAEDTAAWSDKICACLENDTIRERLQRGAYETALRYRADTIAARVERSYESAVIRAWERRHLRVSSVY